MDGQEAANPPSPSLSSVWSTCLKVRMGVVCLRTRVGVCVHVMQIWKTTWIHPLCVNDHDLDWSAALSPRPAVTARGVDGPWC